MAIENWNADVTLLHVTGYQPDDNGNQVPIIEERLVQAAAHEISRAEFYQAAQSGIRPAVMLVVHTFEYDNETDLEYRGQPYAIIRAYERNEDEVELYIQRKVGQPDVARN